MIIKGNAGHIPLPDNSIGAVITDPPYGLGKVRDLKALLLAWINGEHDNQQSKGFMGKDWDKVPSPKIWEEIYRVMKPGAYILTFAGCRTIDLMGISMRLAGFEDNNLLAYVFGSGFPKSCDLGKQIDRIGGKSLKWFINYVLEVAKEKGIPKKELTNLFLSKNGKPTGWLYNKASGIQSLTIKQYNKLKDFLGLPFENLEEAERNIVGKKRAGIGSGETYAFTDNNKTSGIIDITEPATPEAKQWDGWKYGKQAIKPALEPILLMQKPFEKGMTGAENVLKWGVGAVNIDGCRISYENKNDFKNGHHNKQLSDNVKYKKTCFGTTFGYGLLNSNINKGRFPSNLLLQHHPECKLIGMKEIQSSKGGYERKAQSAFIDKEHGLKNIGYGNELIENWKCDPECPIRIMNEQSGILTSGELKQYSHPTTNPIYGTYNHTNINHYDKSKGFASRFFYCSKAPTKERWFYCKVCKEVIPGNEKEKHLKHAMHCLDCNVDFNPREEKHACQEQFGINTTRIEKGYGSPAGIHNKHKTESNFIQHPTQKPEKLIREYLIKLITPPGEIVLDPFGGSGTTAIACRDLGFNCICIDKEWYYCLIAKAREDREKTKVKSKKAKGKYVKHDLRKELINIKNKDNGDGKEVMQLEIFEECQEEK